MEAHSAFLIYAFYLAGLTYFLGVLFYALPIPVEGVKRWGPTLIKDSIYSLVWLSIYNDVIYLAKYILYLLGFSWTGYFDSIYLMATAITAQFVFLEIMKSMIAPVTSITSLTTTTTTSSSGISSFIKLFFGGGYLNIEIHQTQTILLSLYFIIILSDIIYYGMPWLLSLGILLMSLPFRIGRSAGATIISSVLVFYIGLPEMASFMNQQFIHGIGIFGIGITISAFVAMTNPIGVITTMLFLLPVEYESFVIVPIAYISTLIVISLGFDRVIAESANQFPFPGKLII